MRGMQKGKKKKKMSDENKGEKCRGVRETQPCVLVIGSLLKVFLGSKDKARLQ